jgi:hypothetical protein
VYHFSRAIYRELAPYIVDERPSCQAETNRELVLRACERAMERLATDRRHFAKPARSLFQEIRVHFPLTAQLHVHAVTERHVELALRFLELSPEQEIDVSAAGRECQAMTRKGTACRRQPLPRSDYCPSHQHLSEDFEELELALRELDDVGLAA